MSLRRPGPLTVARYLVLGCLALLLASTANAYLALNDVQQRITYRIPENTIWAAAQSEVELARTLAKLAPRAAGLKPVDPLPLNVQFDLLMSRASLYESGVLAQALREDAVLSEAFNAFAADLEAADRLLPAASAGDADAAARMRDLLAPHRATLRKLAMTSLKSDRAERQELAKNHELLQQQLSRFGTAAAILLALMLGYLIHGERRARLLLVSANLARENLEEARERSEKQAEQMRLLARKATTASQAKSDFLAMMSHDIRTPLNAIIGLSDVMEREETDLGKRKQIATVLKASEGLLALINDILDLSRLEAGKLRLEPVAFSPAELVREVMEVTAVLAARNRNRMSVSINPDMPETMIGDRGRIRQVLMNLVGNANKFTRNGDVVIVLDCAGHRNGNGLVRFAVSDNGEGISETLRTRLFQPFEQGENSRNAHEGSSGLGLAISDRLVRLMGGRIVVDSTPGEGAVFAFDIELAVGETAEAGGIPNPGEPRLDLRGKQVLVVDDTAASLLVAQTMFTRFGAQVETAGSGEEAVELARVNAYDLVVLDVQMPGMDGPSAMKAMKREGASGSAMFAALTAQSFPRDRERLLRAGFDAYVSKPVRMRDIESALAPLFDGEAQAVVQNGPAPHAAPFSDEDALDAVFLQTMREDVGEMTMQVLVNQIETEIEASLCQLEDASTRADGAAARKAAHKLAGLLGQFAIRNAAGLARALETETGDIPDSGAVARVAVAARAGVRALRAHLDRQNVNQDDVAA
ncbi:ATP-binding protein [Zhengella sp. ZM62]|uniref:ATP-binding protein n=1 Tax=Zhengella sedimenti TaxID=3390035 RepID=UPI003975631A